MKTSIQQSDLDVFVGYLEPNLEKTNMSRTYIHNIEKLIERDQTVLMFSDQFEIQRTEWSYPNCHWYDCRGNLSFASNDSDVAAIAQEWGDTDQITTPMSIED